MSRIEVFLNKYGLEGDFIFEEASDRALQRKGTILTHGEILRISQLPEIQLGWIHMRITTIRGLYLFMPKH